MRESIGTRVTRLISGSINALVDAAENATPQIVMQESIRELDAAIADIRQELGKEEVKKRNIEESIASDKLKHAKLLEQINVALEEEREDLAEAGVGKQIDIEAQLNVLEEELKQTQTSIKKFGDYIVALQSKKREMKEALERYKSTQKDFSASSISESSISKAEAAFNRVAGYTSTDAVQVSEEESKLEELGELERKNRIKTRLSALKSTLKSND